VGRKKKIQDLELAYLVSLGMSQQEIADKLDVGRSSVTNAMKRLRAEQPQLLEMVSAEEFKKKEGNELDMLRQMIIGALKKKIRNTSLSQMSLLQLNTLYGTLFDKSRLLNDQSTENHAVVTYNQLDEKTHQIIGDTVAQLTADMMKKSTAQAEVVDVSNRFN